MQTDDDPYYTRPKPPLSPPFEYHHHHQHTRSGEHHYYPDASSSSSSFLHSGHSHRHLDHQHSIALDAPFLHPPIDNGGGDNDDDNPDDFYRPFAGVYQSRPDIVLHSESPVVMAVSKHKHQQQQQAQQNGVGAKGTAPSASSFTAPAPRRAASESLSISAAKSTPNLTGSARAHGNNKNTTIKDRIRQFDQSSPAGASKAAGVRATRSRTPSAPRPQSTATDSPGRDARPYRTPQRHSSLARGEVLPPGHNEAHRNGALRKPLFGELLDASPGAAGAGYGISQIATPHTDLHHVSNTRPVTGASSHTRSQSDQHVRPNVRPLDATTLENGSAGTHQRSQSDMSPPTSPLILSPSKIPVRTRRNSDVGPPSGLPSPSNSFAPAAAERKQSHNTPAATSPTARLSPVTLSSRRYSPKRKLEPNQSLSAVVKAPPPKLSPPLRSSRPRLPVAMATTSASRAKVSERLAKANASEIPRLHGVNRKPKPIIPGDVDVAARRARIQTKLYAAGFHPRKMSPTQGVSPTAGKPGRASKPDDEEPPILLQPKAFQPNLPTPRVVVRTDGIEASSTHEEGDTPATEFDESPIPPVEDSDPLFTNVDQELLAPHPDQNQNNLLNHIMSLREASRSTTPGTQAVEDFLSEHDDGETIQIVLGATPILPEFSWKDDIIGQQPSVPDLQGTPESDRGFIDARSSIAPDDSVSMVFHQQGGNNEALGAGRPPVPAIPPSFTLDSEARSQINRFLDQYREGLVTPEMAYGFRQQVEALSPLLPQHNAWTSREATEDYLQAILETASPQLSELDDQRFGTATAEPAPDFNHDSGARDLPESEADQGGIAIIYGEPERYRPTSGESFTKRLNQHAHTASDSTLRPSQIHEMQNGEEYSDVPDVPPEVPPKEDWMHQGPVFASHPRLPEISTGAAGLGLSLGANRTASPLSRLPPVRPPPVPPRLNDPPPEMSARLDGPISPMAYGSPLYSHSDQYSGGSVQSEDLVSPRNAAADAFPDFATRSGKTSFEASRDGGRSRLGSVDTAAEDDGRLSGVTFTNRDLEKELNERRNCIKELVDTEHSYSQDMTIMEDIYMGTASTVLGEDDRRVLFGNLDQVRAFAVQFSDALRHASSAVYTIPRENRWNFKRGSHGTSYSGHTDNSSSSMSGQSDKERAALDEKTTIGQTFLNHVGQIEKIYGDWIVKTNDAANNRLKEIQQKSGVKMWLEECHSSAKDLTQAWSLDALIIKPAQRLMKYPLLLQNLLKCTSRDHPDHSALRQANEALVKITHRINEAKKRAELVDQAMNRKRKDSDTKMRVGKLLNRRTEKLKQQVGLSNASDDQDYDLIAQKFGGHFFQLQIVMRDVEKYLEDIRTSVEWLHMFLRSLVQYSQLDTQERWPEYESNWIRMSQAVQEILEIALPDHVTQVRRCVIDPILTLWKLHVGPQKMMQKRKKRLVDHIRYKTASQKGEKPDKKLQSEEDQYHAVNETLKEELPKLYSLTKKLVEACLANFIDIQAQWQSILKRKVEPFVDDAQHMPSELTQYITALQSTFNQDLAEWEARVKSLGICNGATLADAQNFLSPTTTFTHEDLSSPYKRPSTMSSSRRALSISSEQAAQSTPNFARSGDHVGGAGPFSPSPRLGTFAVADGNSQGSSAMRTRASSAMSSRGPSTPQSLNPQPAPVSQHLLGRPSTASDRQQDFFSSVPRLDLDISAANQGFARDTNFLLSEQTQAQPGTRPSLLHQPTEERFSGIFHSALPMSDSPRSSSPVFTEGEAKILFLAASLFEFNIDGSRREAGYPYLRYVPGEIFDVIGQKGELWLAKNQDDPSGLIGWIWEKHFARILPDEA